MSENLEKNISQNIETDDKKRSARLNRFLENYHLHYLSDEFKDVLNDYPPAKFNNLTFDAGRACSRLIPDLKGSDLEIIHFIFNELDEERFNEKTMRREKAFLRPNNEESLKLNVYFISSILNSLTGNAPASLKFDEAKFILNQLRNFFEFVDENNENINFNDYINFFVNKIGIHGSEIKRDKNIFYVLNRIKEIIPNKQDSLFLLNVFASIKKVMNKNKLYFNQETEPANLNTFLVNMFAIDKPQEKNYKDFWQKVMSGDEQEKARKLNRLESILSRQVIENFNTNNPSFLLESIFVNKLGEKLILNHEDVEIDKLENVLNKFYSNTEHIFPKHIIIRIFEVLNKLQIENLEINSVEDLKEVLFGLEKLAGTNLNKLTKNKETNKQIIDSNLLIGKRLIREDFKNDLSAIIAALALNSYSYVTPPEQRPLLKLSNIQGLIQNSSDLKRFLIFVLKNKDPDDAGKKLERIFGNQYVTQTHLPEEKKLLDRFNDWYDLFFKNPQLLYDTLDIFESTDNQAELSFLTQQINLLSGKQKEEFIGLAKKFLDKGISAYFVLDNFPTIGCADFSKIGLELFQNVEIQKKWLGYCFAAKDCFTQQDYWLPYFKETFETGNLQLESAVRIILKEKLANLFHSSNIAGLITFREILADNFDNSQKIFEEADLEISKNLINFPPNLISFAPHLANEHLKNSFPLIFGKMLEKTGEELETNIDLADYFVENISNFVIEPWVVNYTKKAIKHYSVANKFIEILETHPEYGNVLEGSPDIFELLSEAKEIIKKHKDVFGDTDDFGEVFDSTGKYDNTGIGFLEQDQYQHHKWRLTTQQIILSSALTEIMKNKNADAFEKRGIKNISPEEINPLLEEMNKVIEQAYNKFLDQTKNCSFISKEDKEALVFPTKYKMIPLAENVCALAVRYLVQFSEGNFDKFKITEAARIIEEGFKKYLKIYEVDIPLYDKLYEEFDNLRETGKNPFEVYLGRDGIYAYIGRRSQDVSRRRKLGLKERKKMREVGEVIEINPKYLVYPRYFRDYLSYDVKRQLLEQERITKESDPYFYDTGYTGTIPEQIMRIMDFDKEEIEKRIRLLSAPTVHRRVKGISEKARSEIIEYIEYNAKIEESAEGLIIDEKTGKIRHITRPTTPEEQFYFMMIKQALARHYWLQEKLHHEPSGNVNLDSEHYTLRIRKEYVEFLPDDFIHSPKDFFIQHGELLKGSRGEGEYPDEEIILFKLTDQTEIVAKRIELRKAKEERKEFAILIAAKKAGLPTTEPVGFLSGKEDADGSYLLMKKLEGRSGRKFEKELRESGKYSDEQIKDIMKQVTERNKEMAELFRTTLKIDKRWRIKDTIIEFNEETGEVESVIPIDFERVINYDPANPKEIDEIVIF